MRKIPWKVLHKKLLANPKYGALESMVLAWKLSPDDLNKLRKRTRDTSAGMADDPTIAVALIVNDWTEAGQPLPKSLSLEGVTPSSLPSASDIVRAVVRDAIA